MPPNSDWRNESEGAPARTPTRFSLDDAGKSVVTADGTVVGRIVKVQDADAFLKPKSGLLDGCGSWAAASWDDTPPYRLNGDVVADVTDNVVVLNVAVDGRSPFPDSS